MYLKKLSLINFKNIREENLEFRPGINCFVGDNGAGKTNVIDAVYFLSMCKSSLAMTDGQSIRHGADFFLVEGQYATDGGKSENVVCSFSRKGGKVLKRNGKEYDRLGLNDEYITILGVKVPSQTMPVRPGRNLAIIIEVAARNLSMKKLGFSAARELDRRMNEMIMKRSNPDAQNQD